MGGMHHCRPSMDPHEPAIAAAVGSTAGTCSLGRESSLCMLCTNTRPLLINRTSQDVSDVVMTPSALSAGGMWPLVFWQQLMFLGCSPWSRGSPGQGCSITRRFTPLITAHSPRALLQRLFRDCCHEDGTVKPDFSFPWLQSVSLSHSLTTKLLSTNLSPAVFT